MVISSIFNWASSYRVQENETAHNKAFTNNLNQPVFYYKEHSRSPNITELRIDKDAAKITDKFKSTTEIKAMKQAK